MIQKSDIVETARAFGQINYSVSPSRMMQVRNQARQELALKTADVVEHWKTMLECDYYFPEDVVKEMNEVLKTLRSSSQGDTDKLCGDVNELRGDVDKPHGEKGE